MEPRAAPPPSTADAIRVALVEDDPVVREGLSYLLAASPGMRVVGTHADAESLLAQIDRAPRRPIDVVLMDIDLPGMSGIEAIGALRARVERPPLVVMLTVHGDDEQIFESLRAGACGYLLKTTPPAELVEAITSVHRGGSPMSDTIARRVVASFRQPLERPVDPAISELTPREREVLERLAEGLRYREIADSLGIGLETVRTHIRHVYEKLEVRSRTEAAARWLKL